MPNVGKSSLINSLLRTRAVAVGNLPGITKVPQVRACKRNTRPQVKLGILL